MISTSYVVKNDKVVAKAIRDAFKKVGDLTIPLTQISQDFYKSEQSIFKLKSPGQYPDLAAGTKRSKTMILGSPYPILRFTGRLEKSITSPKHPESINQIINKNTLIIGTRVPYGVFQQEGTKHLPERKFLFIGPEAPRFATSQQAGRVTRWLRIIQNYVDQVIKRDGL